MQVIAHSMGAWVAFEFLCYARSMGLPMPCKVFISAMPYPAIPFNERPWKQQATLNEREFQVSQGMCDKALLHVEGQHISVPSGSKSKQIWCS